MRAPAATCCEALRSDGQSPFTTFAAIPHRIAVAAKRHMRKNCTSACVATARATMKPVDQKMTNSAGASDSSIKFLKGRIGDYTIDKPPRPQQLPDGSC
jgi:hypothetical protein